MSKPSERQILVAARQRTRGLLTLRVALQADDALFDEGDGYRADILSELNEALAYMESVVDSITTYLSEDREDDDLS